MKLDSERSDDLFYAALELRFGIEAKMQQYLDAQDHISNNLKKGWQIAQLGKNIEKMFKSGDKIVKYTIFDQNTKMIRLVLFYTPVNAKLRKMGEQMGNYLHAMKVYRPENDPWWNETRDFLEAVFVELQRANVGTLLGVPLLNTETRQVSMSVELVEDKSIVELEKQFGKPGARILVEVTYLDELPIEFQKGG